MEFLDSWLPRNELLTHTLSIIGIFAAAVIAFFFTRKIFLHGIARIIHRTSADWDDILFDKAVTHRLSYIPSLLIIYSFAYLFGDFAELAQRILIALTALIALLTTGAFLTALNSLYEKLNFTRGKPIKSYIQIIKLFLYLAGTIIIIATLIGKSPWYMLTGLGALTAVILLIFRDTILSFVASLQISSNDLVHIGDWIEVPTFGADGDVIDIALHTIKIQNWDKTITVIPTHKLIEVSFKNWRGMRQSGGRRIKRAVYIDQNSVRFCDKAMLRRFADFHLIRDYIKTKQEEIDEFNKKHGYGNRQTINGRRMTNIGTFRIYAEHYLKNHPHIHHGLTTMVRQLAPGPNGLPLEIYAFTNDINWTRYEAIQADIFDHILAVIPQFELQVFQNPSGKDFQQIGSRRGET